ncbi:hypothetical protein [Janthinobacterium sp. HLX7-2]|uniref:hypothetical protein n=1 Tax=Janthinobacterium sp. HLX7-2 TaxID=1259331 RepID=UPI003F2674CD
MSNSLQTLKTVTLSHESVLVALCALGRQRSEDQNLLLICGEAQRAWVEKEIAITDAAITALSAATYSEEKTAAHISKDMDKGVAA